MSTMKARSIYNTFFPYNLKRHNKGFLATVTKLKFEEIQVDKHYRINLRIRHKGLTPSQIIDISLVVICEHIHIPTTPNIDPSYSFLQFKVLLSSHEELKPGTLFSVDNGEHMVSNKMCITNLVNEKEQENK